MDDGERAPVAVTPEGLHRPDGEGTGRTEVVVIGGGAIGAATAYELSRRGARVVLLEQDGLASGASGRNHGFLWLHLRTPGPALTLSLASATRYRTLEAELEFPFDYRRRGGLVCGTTDDECRILREFVELRRAAGHAFHYLTGDEVRALEPALSPEVRGASWYPDDGWVYPFLLVAGLATAARRHGARIVTGCRVDGIEVAGGRVVGVRHAGGRLAADAVVLAAGAWSPLVSRSIGLELPIEPTKLEMMVTVPLPRRIETVIEDSLALASYPVFRACPSWDPAKLAVNPAAAHGKWFTLLVAQAAAGPVILGETSERVGYRTDLTPAGLWAVAQRARRLFPFLARAPIVRTWTGWLPSTPDNLPLIGRVPGCDGLVLATGHNGFGIMLTPISGELAADAVAGRSNPLFDGVRPERLLATPTASA